MELLWRAAPRCTLVHDASAGGLAACLAEAALHSGTGASTTLSDDAVELFGEVGGCALLACAPERRDELIALAGELGVPVRGIGIAGGATVLGVELARLRSVWDGEDA